MRIAHTTKGGARDVSNACLEAVFGEKPPLNVPYEFFLSKGKKMSSSKGVGTWARDMADFLAPEVLRYLILRTQPQTPVDFPLEPNDPDPKKATGSFLAEEFIVKLFNDLDEFVLAMLPQWERFEGKLRVSRQQLAGEPAEHPAANSAGLTVAEDHPQERTPAKLPK